MKVKIGNYPAWWNTSRFENWYMSKRTGKHPWEVDDNDYTKFDRFVEWACGHWQTVLNCTINKYFASRKRTVKVKIDPYDLFSMDHTLALIILPMLKKLQNTKHGSPQVDDEDVPDSIKSSADPDFNIENYERSGETDKFLHDRWQWVLSEMIWTFEQLNNPDAEDQFHSGNIDILWTPIDKDDNEVERANAKYFRMDKGPNDTHVFDRDGYNAWNKRIDNGLRLFGKYYRGLWT